MYRNTRKEKLGIEGRHKRNTAFDRLIKTDLPNSTVPDYDTYTSAY